MIIKKSEDFHRKFLYDLGDLVINKRNYLNWLKSYDNNLLSVGYGHQPDKGVKFFGSYFEKKLGSYVTDIDVILLIPSVYDKYFYTRLVEILKNLNHESPFQFVRFYTGYKQGLQPPWKIGDEGDCIFDMKKVDDWLSSVKVRYPNVYEKVKLYLVKETISMMDLINADRVIEPMISLTWTKEEIIQGYKMFEGVRYDFKECMYNYPRYRVMKFMYSYQGMYCLVDLNFIALDGTIPGATKDPIPYYSNDLYRKYKLLKRMIQPNLLEQYKEDRKKAISHITPLAAFVELIDRLKKYNTVSSEKIENMEQFAKNYAKQNSIPSIDYAEIQQLILENVTPLYEKYKNFVADRYKLDLFIFEIRTLELEDQISRAVIIERTKKFPQYDCPFFAVNVLQLRSIYFKGKYLLLDPYKIYSCITQIAKLYNLDLNDFMSNVFTTKLYIIRKEQGFYSLYLGNKFIQKSSNVEKLQIKSLRGY